MKIFVRLSGGLGNQLFQLAHAYVLKDRSGFASIYVDVGWYQERRQFETTRTLALNSKETGMPEKSLSRTFWSGKIGLAHLENSEPTRLGQLAKLMGLELHLGYWQDWISVFSVKTELYEVLRNHHTSLTLRRQVRDPYVAVHIRGGDYFDNTRVRDFHGLTDFRQQLSLAQKMADELNVNRVMVFTDSPSLIPSFQIGTCNHLEISNSTDPWEVLFGLAGGQGIVMSNSSLSWWGAVFAGWVSNDPFCVLMPTPWFRNPSRHDVDLLVPGWGTYSRGIIE